MEGMGPFKTIKNVSQVWFRYVHVCKVCACVGIRILYYFYYPLILATGL